MRSSYSARLTEAGLIAGLYAALTLLLQPLSFGPLQVRLAEALTVLPVFTPAAIPGLTLGCAIANTLAVGSNPAGVWDILFGSAATLLAALLTRSLRERRTRGLPLLALLPPVVCNAAGVGLELAVVYFDFSPVTYLLCALQVGGGELLAVYGGGLLLWRLLPARLWS